MIKYPTEEYEQIYTKCISALSLRESITGYRVKTIKAGKMIEKEIYPIWNTKNAQRKAKEQATRPAQQRVNERNSIKQLVRLVNTNFTERDIWLTLTYPPGSSPDSRDRAVKDVENYIRRLRRAAEKAGYAPLKYIVVTETHDRDGKPTHIHHHIITNFTDRDAAEALWKKGGRTQSRRLQPDDFGLEGLARYIGKQQKGEQEQSGRAAHRWRSSKNLTQPTVTTADTVITRRQVERLARASEQERAEYFTHGRPDMRYLDCSVRYSDVVPGAYIYVRMRQEPPKEERQKHKRLRFSMSTKLPQQKKGHTERLPAVPVMRA